MEKKFIGQVAVDSGQLMVIDPAYIENHWIKESESDLIGIKFWGSGANLAKDYLNSQGFNTMLQQNMYCCFTTDSETVEEIEKLLLSFESSPTNEDKIVWKRILNSSYHEVCSLTEKEEKAGMLKNTLGCAFQSGLGDGLYEVYAYYKDLSFNGFEDKRISKLEIILIEDE